MSDMQPCRATDRQSGYDSRLAIKWNRLSILKKVVICYQLRPDIQTYGHQPRYTANADTDAAEIDVCAQNCLVAAASTILFRINWRCVNQVFHVRRIFNNHNSHVWPEANPHAGPCLLPRRLSEQIYCVFLREKIPESCGSSMKGLQLTLHVRSENMSLPLTTIAGLDEAALWLGLPSHRNWHHMTSFYGATWKPWFTHGNLTLKRTLLPVSLRQ